MRYFETQNYKDWTKEFEDCIRDLMLLEDVWDSYCDQIDDGYQRGFNPEDIASWVIEQEAKWQQEKY